MALTTKEVTGGLRKCVKIARKGLILETMVWKDFNENYEIRF